MPVRRNLVAAALPLLLTLAAAQGPPSPADAVESGLQHLRAECAKQRALLPPLLSALRASDLAASKTAYANSRPPYEQIEVLANVFPLIDRDIDARPDVFATGETDALFAGFHVIERALFRDTDPSAALQPAERLVARVDTLCTRLDDTAGFTPAAVWQGALGLALEVPAKKVSSEEETWSDLSLLIFRSNYRGIWAILEPFTALPAAPLPLVRTLKTRYAQIVALLTALDPDSGFAGVNGGAGTRPYAAVGIAERAKLVALAYRFLDAALALREAVLPPSPAEDEEEEETAPRLRNAAYRNETAEGVAFFFSKCREQRRLLAGLDAAVDDRDLHAARHAYRVARPPYEQIEVLAPNFPVEDRDIDARPIALPLGERDADWRGFHVLERQIFREEDLSASRPVLDRLRVSVNSLCRILRDGDDFTADQTWNGMLALAYEVPAKKISSEEESWSDLSIMIFRENAKGIQSQFMPFAKRLPEYIVRDVNAKFEDIMVFWQYVVDKGNLWDDDEYRPYSDVPVYERRTISDLFYAYARSLEYARAALLQE